MKAPKQIKLIDFKFKYGRPLPDKPVKFSKSTKNPLKQTENEVLKAVEEYLEWKGWHCFRIYNGGVPARAINNQIIYKKKDPKYAGVTDLIAIKKEYPVLFIEVKATGKKPQPKQIYFISLVNNSICDMAVCIDSVEALQVFMETKEII